MRVLDFEPADLDVLVEQGGEAFAGSLSALLKPGYGQMLKASGIAWTVVSDTTVLACGGIMDEHEELGMAWSVLNPVASGRHMVMIDRVARRLFSACPKRRIQTTTDPDFEAGKRWLEMLGFTCEGRMRKFTPQGRDQLLYARVR